LILFHCLDYNPPLGKQLGVCKDFDDETFCRNFDAAAAANDVIKVSRFETERMRPVVFIHSKQGRML
jgi:hypothetical protein